MTDDRLMSGDNLGMAICIALGVDPKNVAMVTIECRPRELAFVTIEKFVRNDAGTAISKTLRFYTLSPRPGSEVGDGRSFDD